MTGSSKLNENGFIVSASVLGRERCAEWVREIERSFGGLASDVGCSLDAYLKSVSAWSDRNPLVRELLEEVQHAVACKIEGITGKRVEFLEGKLLMKSSNCPWPTHAHQDLSYRLQTRKKQYHYSSWIALTDVGLEQAPLEFLPGSHLDPVCEYQDYLDPEFVDRRSTRLWEEQARKITVQSGDMVVFDSKVWHGSSAWSKPPTRFTLVLRWTVPSLPDVDVPAPRVEGTWMYDFSEWLEQSLHQLTRGQYKEKGDVLAACIGDHSISAGISDLLKLHAINRAAGKIHGGTAQRGMLWDPLALLVRAELSKNQSD